MSGFLVTKLPLVLFLNGKEKNRSVSRVLGGVMIKGRCESTLWFLSFWQICFWVDDESLRCLLMPTLHMCVCSKLEKVNRRECHCRRNEQWQKFSRLNAYSMISITKLHLQQVIQVKQWTTKKFESLDYDLLIQRGFKST